MIRPSNCPYNELTAAPCFRCPNYHADIDYCGLNNTAGAATRNTATDTMKAATEAQTYEKRINQYEHDRKKLLELSKESLVDLILHRPTPL